MTITPLLSPSANATAAQMWDAASSEQLTPSLQRLRNLAQEMEDEGNVALAVQVYRVADTMQEAQSTCEP